MQTTGTPAIHGEPNSSVDSAPGFMADLIAKDLGLAVSAAREKLLPVAVAAAAQQVYRMASAHDLSRKDRASVYRFLAGRRHKGALMVCWRAMPRKCRCPTACPQGEYQLRYTRGDWLHL